MARHLAGTVLTLATLLALAACAAPETEYVTFDPPYPEKGAGDTPILAAFNGRVPCVSYANGCEKLKVTLVLYTNQKTKIPWTYWLGVVGPEGLAIGDFGEAAQQERGQFLAADAGSHGCFFCGGKGAEERFGFQGNVALDRYVRALRSLQRAHRDALEPVGAR